MDALLVLEDGYTERGIAFGYSGDYFGEIVFNTCITGYQEILTDPSYQDQVIVFTYPQIGNYGVNTEDIESSRVYPSAIVVRELSDYPSNWRSKSSLSEYLKYHGKIAISEIDTRALTRHIREKGAMRCGISTRDLEVETLLRKSSCDSADGRSRLGAEGDDIASVSSERIGGREVARGCFRLRC